MNGHTKFVDPPNYQYSTDCHCSLCYRYYRGLVMGTLAGPTRYIDPTNLKDFILLMALVQGLICQV